MAEITHDWTSFGFVVFCDGNKVAEVHQKTDEGVVIRGVSQLACLPREHWRIHFCSPSMTVELTEAIVASLPKEYAERPKA